MTKGFTPPPYPHDRLKKLLPLCDRFDGGMIDLSAGDPRDASPEIVRSAISNYQDSHRYPQSIGTSDLRQAASDWIQRRFEVDCSSDAIAAVIGTKEFIGSAPHFLHLRTPDKDTVLYPSISYPTYEMGAILAGLRAVPVAMNDDGSIDVSSISSQDASRALCFWTNSPSNPTGALDDLSAVAQFAADTGVTVLSDECYCDFVWDDKPESILQFTQNNVLAVHSISKRSNAAGVRIGFYAGDPELVSYLSEIRKHAGMMPPGPMQAGGVAALSDDTHVELQRNVYKERLQMLRDVLNRKYDLDIQMPRGGFYLWFKSPEGDGWDFAERLATDAGVIGSPGDFYGSVSTDHLRLAVVEPTDRIALIAQRLGV